MSLATGIDAGAGMPAPAGRRLGADADLAQATARDAMADAFPTVG
ncbi:hypothetical protein ACGFOU_16410 [Streptomyces sp. NPDC048595]